MIEGSNPEGDAAEAKSYIVDKDGVPDQFPTHRHSAAFWEALGRAVATYGFLEETLGKAIFAITATTEYSDEAVMAAVEKWSKTIKAAVSDPMGAKIAAFEKAITANAGMAMSNPDELIADLRTTAQLRNALCHGSWGVPDTDGRSLPFFVDRKLRKFETEVDVAFLSQTQRHVAELCMEVMNSVTTMGWQFPGSSGPGKPVWPASS